MSARAERIISILKTRIPVREGTQTYQGYVALMTCDGKTYKYFRGLSGGPRNSKDRKFSPSTIWRLAEAEGFAAFQDETLRQPVKDVVEDTDAPKSARNTKAQDGSTHPQNLNDVRILNVAKGSSLDSPGIYAWKIEGIGIYVGKYTHRSRPMKEYDKNVRRLLAGEEYRPKKPDGFRRIHRALASAVTNGLGIELHILENCSQDDLNTRERHFISTLAEGDLNA